MSTGELCVLHVCVQGYVCGSMCTGICMQAVCAGLCVQGWLACLNKE